MSILLFTTAALAQAEGEVESLGFQGYYRPNCWTPMRIRLRPQAGSAQRYLIQVVQEDLDRDQVAYSRPLDLTGNVGGGRLEERAWAFFRPQPNDLPPGLSTAELSNRIRVYLCDAGSGRQLMQIPIAAGTPFRNVEDPQTRQVARGMRIVLQVVAAGSNPAEPYAGPNMQALGINEDVMFIRMSPNELPGNALGLEAADAVVWHNADPNALNSDAAAALEEWVRGGGRLVVCQGANWQVFGTSPLAPLLPVTPAGTREETGAVSMRRLAGVPNPMAPLEDVDSYWKRLEARPATQPAWVVFDPWEPLLGQKASLGVGEPRAGALVLAWSANEPATPYLVRWMHGMGTVTWLAQDPGDPNLVARTRWGGIGWGRAWDRILDLPNRTVTAPLDRRAGASSDVDLDAQLSKRRYGDEAAAYDTRVEATDLGAALLPEMEHGGRGMALVGLAVVFFIAYGLVAGPGMYLALKARRQTRYSWPAFAGCAVGATVLTMGVVRLVLGGAGEVRHVTFVRSGADGQAIAWSDLGLYIPRDGMQRIELVDVEPQRPAYLAPYPIHPEHRRETADVVAYQSYQVPVRERSSTEGVAIDVPYRSTLKKFQAKWAGKMPGIGGRLSFDDRYPTGALVNNTGRDLYSVYMVYRRSPSDTDDQLVLLFDGDDGPAWPAGKSIDVFQAMSAAKLLSRDLPLRRTKDVSGARSMLNTFWMPERWAPNLRTQSDRDFDSLDAAALLLGIFDRLAPSRKASQEEYRLQLLRRGARQVDASAAVGAGHLLILCRSAANAPLPFELRVAGDRVQSRGTVYYQFIIPVDRTGPATQPIER